MYNKIIIGIDQSYQCCGISLAADEQLKKVTYLPLDKLECNSDKRRALSNKLDSLLRAIYGKSKEIICIIERIRLQSQGFINIDYIKSIGALNSVIVDACKKHNVKVYSVDTRCWKANVIGTSKGQKNNYGVPEEKWPTVNYVLKKGFKDSILMKIEGRKAKGTFIGKDGQKYMFNNDAADSAGIAMSGFNKAVVKDKLKEEK